MSVSFRLDMAFKLFEKSKRADLTRKGAWDIDYGNCLTRTRSTTHHFEKSGEDLDHGVLTTKAASPRRHVTCKESGQVMVDFCLLKIGGSSVRISFAGSRARSAN